jgi:hypothetical protein
MSQGLLESSPAAVGCHAGMRVCVYVRARAMDVRLLQSVSES